MPGTAGLQPGRIPSLSGPDQGQGSLRAPWHGAGSLQPGRQGPHQERPDAAADRPSLRKTSAQVCLRWLVQRNVSAIPRTSKLERLSENFEIFDFELSDADMREISDMGSAGGRLTDFAFAPKWD